ncbi:MAG: EF-hand domain-containing protein [Deltaproteobacteria bacterium]
MTIRPTMALARWLVAAATATLAGCSSMPSLTGASASSMDRTFISAAQTWDFDKDGSVTCDEWKNYVATLVRESDGNGDGALDAEDFKKLAKTDQLFSVADLSYYDTNGDGRVTIEEMTAKPNAAFKLLDKNGVCRIDRNESVRVLQVDAPKASSAPNTDQQVPGGR